VKPDTARPLLAAISADRSLKPSRETPPSSANFRSTLAQPLRDRIQSDQVLIGLARPHGGKPGFNVALSTEGSKKYEKVSTENVGRTLAIIVDGKVVMAPKILDPGQARGFLLTVNSEAEARKLAENVRQAVSR
jgi:preprotein translocase subunit SecD